MAREKIEVDVCDNPDCKKRVEILDEISIGYHMTATRHRQTGGGEGGDVFACSEKCIRAAVINICDLSLLND